MGLLGWLTQRDRDLAASSSGESASDQASRKRRERHTGSSATKAFRKGQKWEDESRRRENYR